jgi:flagellin
MGMTINNLSQSMYGAHLLNKINSQMENATTRLATGVRINSAADDPAGLAIATKFKAQIGSWGAVEKNLTSGNSVLGASDKALESVNNIMLEMRTVAQQAASDNLSVDQRTNLSKTFVELQSQLDTIVDSASINGKNLVGSAGADVDIQSGINAGDTFTLTAADSSAATLGVAAAAININSAAGAQAAMTALDTGIDVVSGNRAVIGAQMRGLEAMTNNASNMKSNIEAARSRIEDTDIGEESARLTQLQVKQQTAVAMLGITNSMSQNLLGLLRF